MSSCWFGPPMLDPTLEKARRQLILAEQSLNEASGAAAIDAAIQAVREAEAKFNERLQDIRHRYKRYGVIEWGSRAEKPMSGRKKGRQRAAWTG